MFPFEILRFSCVREKSAFPNRDVPKLVSAQRKSLNEKICQDFRKLFENITMKSKRKYYSKKLLQFQGDVKKNMTNYERSDRKI